MYNYFLGSFGNKSFLFPQYEILKDGSLEEVHYEDRYERFPNGGTVSINGVDDIGVESIKNRIVKFKIDFNNDLHHYYKIYSENSNKYIIPLSYIEELEDDEIVEIIDLNCSIHDFLRDKLKRKIRIQHKPNKLVFLRNSGECFGPFEFIVSSVDEHYGDYTYYTIEVFVNSGLVKVYNEYDIRDITNTGRYSGRKNDKIEFIYKLKELENISPSYEIEYFDDEDLIDFLNDLIKNSENIENVIQINTDLLKLVDNFNTEKNLNKKKLSRLIEIINSIEALHEYKLKLTEEYFKNNPKSISDKEEYLNNHEELLESMARESIEFERRKEELQKEIDELNSQKDEIKDELERVNTLLDKQKEKIKILEEEVIQKKKKN